AGFWSREFHIVLPLLRPILTVAGLFGIIFAFTDMTVIYVLTRGGPAQATQVLSSLAFFTGILGGDLAGGAAISLFLFPVLVVVAIIMLQIARRTEGAGAVKAGRRRKLAGRASLYVTVTAFAAVLAFPFYWMLLATFKTDRDLYELKNNPLIFNDHLTLANLQLLFEKTLYLTWLWNTLIVGGLAVLTTLALALPAGYALARLTGKWGERLGIGIFLTYLVPSTLLFIPMSRIVARLGLQDTL